MSVLRSQTSCGDTHSIFEKKKNIFQISLTVFKILFSTSSLHKRFFCRLTQDDLFAFFSGILNFSRIFFVCLFVCFFVFVLKSSLFRIFFCLSEFASWFYFALFTKVFVPSWSFVWPIICPPAFIVKAYKFAKVWRRGSESDPRPQKTRRLARCLK